MADIVFELGPDRLVVKEDQLTVKVAKSLRTKIREVKDTYNKNLEDQSAIINEVLKKYESELVKSEDESDDSYNERIKPLLESRQEEVDAIIPDDKESYVMKLAFECLKKVGELFGQSNKVTESNFENASWPKVKVQLAKLLLSNECELGTLFLPPMELNQKS